MARHQVLRNLKKVWVGGLLSLLVIIPDAYAEESKIQKMTYDVYASGFHVVGADLTLDLSKKDRYSAVLTAYTRGFLGKLAPWKGAFASYGWKQGKNKYQPETHTTTTTWREEDEIKEYTYDKDGAFKEMLIAEHGKEAERREVSQELTQGTTDILTAALHVMENVADGKECEGSSDVFDGKRRFEMIFRHKGIKELAATRYNIYEGIAHECTVEVKPEGGKWHEKPRGWMSIQEQGRQRGTMPTVWMAKINEDGPAVPVKIRVKTNYGALFMHLVEYDDGQKHLIAEKKEDQK